MNTINSWVMFVLPKHQAACVLMFHLQKDEFPVDTHVRSHENYRCYSFTFNCVPQITIDLPWALKIQTYIYTHTHTHTHTYIHTYIYIYIYIYKRKNNIYIYHIMLNYRIMPNISLMYTENYHLATHIPY